MSWPALLALLAYGAACAAAGYFWSRRRHGDPDATLKMWDGRKMTLAVRVRRAPSGTLYVECDDLRRGLGL